MNGKHFRKPGDILFTAEETRLVDSSGAAKGYKPVDYALIPWQPLAELAAMYGAGRVKYGANNWRAGYAYSLSLSAMQRHLEKFRAGEDTDPETKAHHLAAVMFHCCALMTFQYTGVGTDDRA